MGVKMPLITCLFLIAFLLFSTAATAQKIQTSVDVFLEGTQAGTTRCSFFWLPDKKDWRSKKDTAALKIKECIDRTIESSEGSFSKAVESIKNKPAAVEALKTYYVAWLLLMNGPSLYPNNNEGFRAYSDRQLFLSEHLKPLITKAQIEARY